MKEDEKKRKNRNTIHTGLPITYLIDFTNNGVVIILFYTATWQQLKYRNLNEKQTSGDISVYVRHILMFITTKTTKFSREIVDLRHANKNRKRGKKRDGVVSKFFVVGYHLLIDKQMTSLITFLYHHLLLWQNDKPEDFSLKWERIEPYKSWWNYGWFDYDITCALSSYAQALDVIQYSDDLNSLLPLGHNNQYEKIAFICMNKEWTNCHLDKLEKKF